MLSLKDIWGENYYLPTGGVNPECRLFAGMSEENKNKYLQEYLCSTNKSI